MEPGHAGHWRTNDWILEYDGKSEATNKHLWTEKEFGDFVLIADWRFTRKPSPKKVSVILPDGSYALEADGSRKMVEVPDAGDRAFTCAAAPRPRSTSGRGLSVPANSGIIARTPTNRRRSVRPSHRN
jgi:hypothetical protein